MTPDPVIRAAADLAALLPIDDPLARLGRLRLDSAVSDRRRDLPLEPTHKTA